MRSPLHLAALGLLATAGACTTYDARPHVVARDAVAIDAFGATTCVASTAGTVTCLGAAIPGTPPATSATSTDAAPPFPSPPVQLAVGAHHACALLTSGWVACWGDDHDGVLGFTWADCQAPAAGTAPSCVADPTPVPRLTATEIDAGDDFTCAVDTDHHVVCWGVASGGRLGHDVTGVVGPAPVRLDGVPLEVRRVAVAAHRACAVTTGGEVVCWGGGLGGPTRVDVGVSVEDVAVSDDHACAIATGGDVWCWGANQNGQAGAPDLARACQGGTCAIPPTRVPQVAGAVSIAVGDRHSCAATGDGVTICWGDNERDQLGRDDSFLLGAPGPAPVDGIVQVTAGTAHTCARDGDGAAWCFGDDGDGQSGGAS